MIALSVLEVAIWFVFGLVLGAVLVTLVNYLVKRRLGELLRRAVEDDDDDWPAPPRYDDDTPPM